MPIHPQARAESLGLMSDDDRAFFMSVEQKLVTGAAVLKEETERYGEILLAALRKQQAASGSNAVVYA